MTRDVLISISGAQFSEFDSDDVKMITTGDYYMKNGKHYILYDEIVEDSGEIIKNTIKIRPDGMDVIKKGSTTTHMVFEKNKKNLSCYMTPFGEMIVGIATSDIQIQEEEHHLRVNVEYSLDINYEHISDCNITLSVRAKNADGVLGMQADMS